MQLAVALFFKMEIHVPFCIDRIIFSAYARSYQSETIEYWLV